MSNFSLMCRDDIDIESDVRRFIRRVLKDNKFRKNIYFDGEVRVTTMDIYKFVKRRHHCEWTQSLKMRVINAILREMRRHGYELVERRKGHRKTVWVFRKNGFK